MKLSDIVDINPKLKLGKGVSFPFVEMKDLDPSVRSVYPSMMKDFTGSGSKFQFGDTLFARITPCLENGKTSQYRGESSPAWGSTEFIVLRGKEGLSDNNFIYYFARLPELRAHAIQSMVGSSGRQRAPNGAIAEFEFPFPSLNEQKAIAHILGALDDKIEINQEMNQTLEEIAKAIFKSWFVDFDPVRAKAEGRPTRLPPEISDLFPAELVESEIEKIPMGWSVKNVGNLVTPSRGKTITKKKCVDGDVPVVAGGLSHAYFHNVSNVSAPVVTISASGANAGFTRLYNKDIWASDCSFISNDQSSTPYMWYVFLKLNQEKIFHMQQGAAQPHIYPSDIMRLTISYPPDEDIWDKLNSIISPMFERITVAERENELLSELRDTLLPKLISGELRVPDAEKCLEEAGI